MSGIEVRNLGKHYDKGASAWRGSAEQNAANHFWAVREASFSVSGGEIVAVLGRNGAGKSTLLKMLSRVVRPSEGEAIVRGRLASLLEVGTGFHPELSGRDNIFLNAAVLGLDHATIRKKFDEIVSFSEVEHFIDEPVKRYSSGMYVKLAFAVAAHVDPDVLILDEVLAVGDAAFQKKSLNAVSDLSLGGKRVVLFVSHNIQAVRKFCTRAIVLDAGRICFDGDLAEGIERYLHLCAPDKKVVLGQDQRILEDAKFVASDGQPCWTLKSGDGAHLVIRLRSGPALKDRRLRISLVTADDRFVVWSRTESLDSYTGTGRAECNVDFAELPLRPAELFILIEVIDAAGDILETFESTDHHPFLVVASPETDSYRRRGVVSIDYKLTSSPV